MNLCAPEHLLDISMLPHDNGMISLIVHDRDNEESRLFIINGDSLRHWYGTGPASRELLDVNHYDVVRITVVNRMFHITVCWLWRKEFDLRGRISEFELDDQEFIQTVFHGQKLTKTCMNTYLARDLDIDAEW